jgi:hypothetical protein
MLDPEYATRTPWPQVVKDKQLYECRHCTAVVSGVRDGNYGRSPNPTDPTLCECCECRCYAAALDQLTRFGLRRGAHALDCPIYRPSLDPVDAANDQETRDHYTKGG